MGTCSKRGTGVEGLYWVERLYWVEGACTGLIARTCADVASETGAHTACATFLGSGGVSLCGFSFLVFKGGGGA